MESNPIRAALLELAPTIMAASRKINMSYETVRRTLRGLPKQIPASFKMALMEHGDWSVERLHDLDIAYQQWRANKDA